MTSTIRDLVIGIGWRINDKALRRADKDTDNYVGTVQAAERSMSSLADEIVSMSRQGQRAFGNLEGQSKDLDRAIERINDPQISSAQAERELHTIRELASRLDLDLRDLQMEVDNSQAKRSLDDVKDEAMDLQDVLGGLGGGIAGGAIADDISTLAQIPRELEASLGVTEKVAKDLAEETENVFVNVKGLNLGEAAESIMVANRVFDETGNRAGVLGQKIAMLNRETGESFQNIGLAARNMVNRFPDIQSEAQAFDILLESSQRLGNEGFSELIDQTQEYGSVLSQVMTGKEFFGNMIKAGEENTRVMDKLGDTLSTELIPRIQDGETEILSALTAVAANAEGIEGVTRGSYEEFVDLSDKVSALKAEGKEVPEDLASEFTKLGNQIKPASEMMDQWRESIVAGGDEGREATREIINAFSELEGTQRKEVGTSLFKTMYEEQGPALDKLFNNWGEGIDNIGTDFEKLSVKGEGTLNQIQRGVKEARTEVSWLTDTFGGLGEAIGGALPYILGFAGAGGLGKVKGMARGTGRMIGKLSTRYDGLGRTVWNTSKKAGRGVVNLGSKLGIFGQKAWSVTKTVGRSTVQMGGTIVRWLGIGARYFGRGSLAILKFGGQILKAGFSVVKFGLRIGKLFTPLGWLITLAIDVGETIVSNWSKITGSAGEAETAIGGFFRGMWTAAKLYINKTIDRVNWLIGVINKIPKVNIPEIGKLNVFTPSGGPPVAGTNGPGGHVQMAKGGKVTGSTFAEIGEGADDEAVIPLNKHVYAELGEGIESAGKDKPSTQQQTNYTFAPTITVYTKGTQSASEQQETKQQFHEWLDEWWASMARRNPRPTEG